MEKKRGFHQIVEEIYVKDRRYKQDAYEFLLCGLTFTQGKLKRKAHVSGRELAYGLKDYAVDQYGALATRVLSHWGINNTRDFGNIVFNMIEHKLLSRNEEDSLEDFNAVYDFEEAFADVLTDTVTKGFREKNDQ